MQDAGLQRIGKKVFFDVHHQLFGEAEQIFATSAITEQFGQARDPAHARVGQQLVSRRTNG